MERSVENYEKACKHWTSMASNVNGMLGGFERLHIPDINGSKQFLDELSKKHFLLNFGRALDCGSGIGRVTKHLLLPTFDSVDMVDFTEHFIQQSKDYIGEEANSRVGQKFVESLHTFTPEAGRYDLIWIQWVTDYISDGHFIEFLQRCKDAICENNGCIVVKENMTKGGERDLDETDNSCVRSLADFNSIFEKAGCKIVAERRQLHFPKDIYAVRMFALKPIREEGEKEEEEIN